jgi:hypothetical protein
MLFIYLLVDVFSIEDLGKKPTDMVAPLLCLLGIFKNRLG